MRVKNIIAILFFHLVVQGNAVADNWTTENSQLEAAFQALNVADWMQTQAIAETCMQQGYHFERNPLLGTCPTQSEVNRYFVAGAVAHAGISYLLPARYRKKWQWLTIGIGGAIVARNYHIGIRFSIGG